MVAETSVDPYCIACGAVVGFQKISGNRSTDIASFDPKSRVEWGGLYRMVFRMAECSPYRLSGIARLNEGVLFSVLPIPYDRDTINLGFRKRIRDPDAVSVRLLNFVNGRNRDGEGPEGYVLHANCWTLLERVFGPQVGEVEGNLELLLHILRERWDENPFNIHHYIGLDQRSPWSEPNTMWRSPTPGSRDGRQRMAKPTKRHYRKERVHDREFDTFRTKHIISLRDPLHIPEIHKLIRRSIHNKSRENMKRKTRRWRNPPPSQGYQLKSSNSGPFTRLLPEIILLILDNLTSHTDVNNALAAFRWQVPDPYWKSRVPVDLVFELEELENPGDLHWQSLYRGISRFSENLPELQNRQRVLGLLEEVKRRFLVRARCAS